MKEIICEECGLYESVCKCPIEPTALANVYAPTNEERIDRAIGDLDLTVKDVLAELQHKLDTAESIIEDYKARIKELESNVLTKYEADVVLKELKLGNKKCFDVGYCRDCLKFRIKCDLYNAKNKLRGMVGK
jgi:hypothetical protein